MGKKYWSLLGAIFFSQVVAGAETSRFWCNERFLSAAQRPFDAQHLKIAKRGYLYALAAALALQKDDPEGRAHYFTPPPRMLEVDRPHRDASGFEAVSFEIHALDGEQSLQEVVVAFTGSNDDADWKDANFGSDRRQYRLARKYLKTIALRPQYRGVRVVATGFSLGGALAVHVTKHHETSAFVAETWAFNPSPKTWVSGKPDRRIWLAAVQDEALHFARSKFLAALVPGVSPIGAPHSQTAEGFYLLEANPVYRHFRWVLTRNILYAADLALMAEQPISTTTEPLDILQASHFASCTNENP
ncbi:MAG: DUF2974 domain-containing protein [Uliginosibacterium sp.]|nr:DUF2974 domain-containing protein [Uliginosibacterium sp.]